MYYRSLRLGSETFFFYLGSEIEAPRIYRQQQHEGGRVASNNRQRLSLPSEDIHGTRFRWRLSRAQDHSAAGRIMSMKTPSDSNWNRTHNHPVTLYVHCLSCSQRSPRAVLSMKHLLERLKLLCLLLTSESLAVVGDDVILLLAVLRMSWIFKLSSLF